MAELLVNLRLWDGLAETAMDGAAVLIEGSRIAWAGHKADAPDSAGAAELVDCGGGVLLPGLIDAHIHLGMVRGPTPADSAAAILAHAAAALDVGLTAVRDLGAPNHGVIAAARLIAGGAAPGPRIIAAGRPVSLPGGYMTGVAVEAADAGAVRVAVEQQAAAGAGVIKVIASPVPPAPVPDMPRSFGLDNLRAAVDTAHAAGLRITAHAHSLAGARDAVLAGCDCIEHGYRLDAETIAEMARRQTWLVPTLVAMERAQAPHLGPGRPDGDARRARERWEAAAEAAHAAHRAGIRIAAGTDAVAAAPVHAVRREVALLVETAGLTPRAALMAATSAAADLLGIAADTGAIVAGRRADLLLVGGDPLAGVEALEQVRAVWRDGARVAVKR